MKEQTAVEFLFSELERCQYFIGNDIFYAYQEALKKEKEQMCEAVDAFLFNGLSVDEYYNQTYKKEIEKK